MKYYVKAYDRVEKEEEMIENILLDKKRERTLDIPDDDLDLEKYYRVKDEIKNIINERGIWV